MLLLLYGFYLWLFLLLSRFEPDKKKGKLPLKINANPHAVYVSVCFRLMKEIENQTKQIKNDSNRENELENKRNHLIYMN